jgi:hypothetical protein
LDFFHKRQPPLFVLLPVKLTCRFVQQYPRSPWNNHKKPLSRAVLLHRLR